MSITQAVLQLDELSWIKDTVQAQGMALTITITPNIIDEAELHE